MGGGPKRNKKRNKRGEEQDEDEKFNSGSKWASILENEDLEEGDPEELYSKPTKQIYEYDFSNQKYMFVEEKKASQNPKKYADYSPEELQKLQKLKQKAKVDKEIKNKIKKQKRQQRMKEAQIQKEKEEEQKSKEKEEEKRIQQEVEKTKKSQNNWVIPIILLSFMILMGVLQFNSEIYKKLSKFQNDDIDYYEVLEIDQAATDKDIKQKYKKLVLKYHPDRNPNCQNCKQKFDNIMQAWEILGDPEKRKNYDKNSAVISQIKSSSITLTPKNYGHLVEESQGIWIIQVYDSTSQYSVYFNQFWEEAMRQYSDIVDFGRIDSWHQSDMLSYIPYKFQIFPGLYILDHGYSEICSIDHQKPLNTIRRCIEQHLEKLKIEETRVFPSQQSLSQLYRQSEKIPIKISAKLGKSHHIKAINKMFADYFDFYYIEDNSTQKRAIVYKYTASSNLRQDTFKFTNTLKATFKKYREFLESQIIQRVSLCKFLNTCEEKKCLLVLNSTHIEKVNGYLPVEQSLATFILTNENKMLTQQIDRVKQISELHQDFEVALYENGKIDMGYIDEVSQLDSSIGQLIGLQCRLQTWTQWIQQLMNL